MPSLSTLFRYENNRGHAHPVKLATLPGGAWFDFFLFDLTCTVRSLTVPKQTLGIVCERSVKVCRNEK